MSVVEGDEVTAVWTAFGPDVTEPRAVLHHLVVRSADTDWFSLADGVGVNMADRQGNEGVTWVRGHVAPDSSQAQALLAAYALSYAL